MNYALHYEKLIARAKGRADPVVVERHHVVPRCMGGGDDRANLVSLTPEEHYLAHQLLVKMYPDVKGLAIAAVRMAKQCTSNKAYGWLRKRHGEAMRQLMRGRVFTAEWRKKISLGSARAKRGNQYRLGKTHSAETRAKISVTSAARRMSPDARAKISAALRGRPKSQAMREKLSRSMIGNFKGVRADD